MNKGDIIVADMILFGESKLVYARFEEGRHISTSDDGCGSESESDCDCESVCDCCTSNDSNNRSDYIEYLFDAVNLEDTDALGIASYKINITKNITKSMYALTIQRAFRRYLCRKAIHESLCLNSELNIDVIRHIVGIHAKM